MRYLRFILILMAIPASAQDNAALEQEARVLTQQFIGQLKPQLMQAMSEGGPSQAIEVCASLAPRIADAMSATSGWNVKRVSLKARNAVRATPDTWEQEVLEHFDRRQSSGEPAQNIYLSAIVGSQYRYMQAQPTGALCLTCHGANLAVPVQEALQQYYPDDLATGYQLGQVRGAISLSKRFQSTSAMSRP